MDHTERLSELENLKDNMLRRMEEFTAALQHTKQATDSTVEGISLSDQRIKRIEAILLRHDERQDATLRLLMQQTDHLSAAFRTLEAHDGRIQKLEGNQAA